MTPSPLVTFRRWQLEKSREYLALGRRKADFTAGDRDHVPSLLALYPGPLFVFTFS